LKKQLANAPAKTIEKVVVDQMAIDRAVAEARKKDRRLVDGMLRSIGAQDDRVNKIRNILGEMQRDLADIGEVFHDDVKVSGNAPVRVFAEASRTGPTARAAFVAKAREPRADAGDSDMPIGERTILQAIAQYDDGADRDQLTVLTGYKRSSRNTYISRLATRGFLSINGDRVIATDEGIAALGDDYEPLPSGNDLREFWMNRLPDGERKILEILCQAYPNTIGRDDLDEPTGYKRSSRNTYLSRLSTRRLVVSDNGGVRASATLFE
jgi:hypothetical protein